MQRLGLGIVGLGRGATLTVPALVAHPRIDVVAGTDPDAAAREGFARQTGIPTCPSFAALLDHPKIAAVYIASPHGHHAEQTGAAARAGKHVLVEKPMAVSLADAQAMVAAAKRAGTVLMIGPSHGYDPPVALATGLIAGVAGAARMIHAMNYTDFLYRPRRPEELDRVAGGGVVFSQATHQIDIVRRLAASPVKSVRGWVGDWDRERRSDGAFTALLTFESGAAASLTYSGYARYDSDALAGWVGEMGVARAPDARSRQQSQMSSGEEKRAKAARGFGGEIEAAAPDHHERFGQVIASCRYADLELTPDGVILHGRDGPTLHRAPLPLVRRHGVADCLAAAVLDGAVPIFDGRWGLETLACCHALIASARDGGEIAPADLIPNSETLA